MTGIYRTAWGEAFAIPHNNDDDEPDTIPDGAVAHIDQARIAARLTPHQLADRAWLAGTTVAAILAGSRTPPPAQIQALYTAVGIQPPTRGA